MNLDIKIVETLKKSNKQPLFIDGVITRSISQILIDADNASELKVLSHCWKEIVKNKYCYTLAELKFSREHLEELSRKMARKDIDANRDFFDLWNGVFNGL